MYGPDTNKLFDRISGIKNGRLILYGLNITGLPSIPKHVTYLDCRKTNIKTLPYLPMNLEYLYVSETNIRKIRYIPYRVKILDVSKTKIESLPKLPRGLQYLDIYCTPQLKFIPIQLNKTITSVCGSRVYKFSSEQSCKN